MASAGAAASVEAGQVDDGDGQVAVAALDGLVPHLRGLILEVDFVAHDVDLEGLGLLALAQQSQAHGGALLAADQAHDVAQGHVDHVDGLSILSAHLLDRDDAILALELALSIGGAAFDDLVDDRIAVAAAQDGADAFQAQAHADAEVFEGFGREVGGMRIERGRIGVEQTAVHIAVIALVDALGDEGVALVELGLGLGEGGAGADVVGELKVDQLAAQFVALGLGLRAGTLVGIHRQFDGAIDLQIRIGEDLGDMRLNFGLSCLLIDFEVGHQAALAVDGLPEEGQHLHVQRLRFNIKQQALGWIEAFNVDIGNPLHERVVALACADVQCFVAFHQAGKRGAVELVATFGERRARDSQAADQQAEQRGREEQSPS